MKILITKYKEALKTLRSMESKSWNVIELVKSRLHELGVITPYSIYCGKVIEITLESGVDPNRILKIEADIRSTIESCDSRLRMKYWGTRKSRPYEIFTSGCVTFIDIDAKDTYLHYAKQTGSYEQALYQTLAAYVVDVKNGEKWYDAHWDRELKHGYIMHCSRTLTLTDLWRNS